MDGATRDRFAKVKALMASPNAGEAAAAKARYAAMVEKHGDPDASPHVMAGHRAEYVFGHSSSRFRADGFGDADFATIFNDLFSYARRSAEERAAAQRDSVATQLELGRECGRAVTFIIDDLGLAVEGFAGGPWTIYDHTDESHGPFGMRGVIDFARERGFR